MAQQPLSSCPKQPAPGGSVRRGRSDAVKAIQKVPEPPVPLDHEAEAVVSRVLRAAGPKQEKTWQKKLEKCLGTTVSVGISQTDVQLSIGESCGDVSNVGKVGEKSGAGEACPVAHPAPQETLTLDENLVITSKTLAQKGLPAADIAKLLGVAKEAVVAILPVQQGEADAKDNGTDANDNAGDAAAGPFTTETTCKPNFSRNAGRPPKLEVNQFRQISEVTLPRVDDSVLQWVRFDLDGRIYVPRQRAGENVSLHDCSSTDGRTLREIIVSIADATASVEVRAEALQNLAAVLTHSTREIQQPHSGLGCDLGTFCVFIINELGLLRVLGSVLDDEQSTFLGPAAARCLVALLDSFGSIAYERLGQFESGTNFHQIPMGCAGEASDALDEAYGWRAAFRCSLDRTCELVLPCHERRHLPTCTRDLWRENTDWPLLILHRFRSRHFKKTGIMRDVPEDDQLMGSAFPSNLERLLFDCTPGPHRQEIMVQALTAISAYSARSCKKVMETCSSRFRLWLHMIGGGSTTPCGAPTATGTWLRYEMLRFVRVTCQVGGRSAVQLWLPQGHEMSEWSAVTVARQSLLDGVTLSTAPPRRSSIRQTSKCHRTNAGLTKLEGSGETPQERDAAALRAVEAIRLWMIWLHHGIGVDAVDTVLPVLVNFLCSLVDDSGYPAEGSKWCLGGHLMKFFAALAQANEPQDPLLLGLSAASRARSSNLVLSLVDRMVGAVSKMRPWFGAKLFCLIEFTAAVAVFLQKPEMKQSSLVAAAETLLALPLSDILQPWNPKAYEEARGSWNPSPDSGLRKLMGLRAIAAQYMLLEVAASLAPRQIHDVEHRKLFEGIVRALPNPETGKAHPYDMSVQACIEVLVIALSAIRAVKRKRALAGNTQRFSPMKRSGSKDRAGLLHDKQIRELLGKALASSCYLRSGLQLFDLVDVDAKPLNSVAVQALLRTSQIPDETCSLLRPEGSFSAPRLQLAAVPYWALASRPRRAEAIELIMLLDRQDICEAISGSIPPWLPFVSLCALLHTPLSNQEDGKGLHAGLAGSSDFKGALKGWISSLTADDVSCWAWSVPEIEAALLGPGRLGSRVFGLSDGVFSWLDDAPTWLLDTMVAQCGKLCEVFCGVGKRNVVLARALTAFVQPRMPKECRQAVLGETDMRVPVDVARALSEPDGKDFEKALSATDSSGTSPCSSPSGSRARLLKWTPSLELLPDSPKGFLPKDSPKGTPSGSLKELPHSSSSPALCSLRRGQTLHKRLTETLDVLSASQRKTREKRLQSFMRGRRFDVSPTRNSQSQPSSRESSCSRPGSASPDKTQTSRTQALRRNLSANSSQELLSCTGSKGLYGYLSRGNSRHSLSRGTLSSSRGSLTRGGFV